MSSVDSIHPTSIKDLVHETLQEQDLKTVLWLQSRGWNEMGGARNWYNSWQKA